MPRSSSIQLVRIFGIRIGVDVSWFFVLFLFIFLVSRSFQDVLAGSDGQAYLTAVASVLLFFTSIVLHELGHALVARRLGIGITGIDLWMFGGIAMMSREAESPGEEAKVAIAGPLVTFAIAAACIAGGVAAYGANDFLHIALLDVSAPVTAGTLLLSWLALMNVGLLVFNLVPAFPLDGGRIARAVVWRVTGDRARGTQAAARSGQAFSYLLIGLGVYLALRGDLLDAVWSVGIGLLLGQVSRAELARTAFTQRIANVRVEDIMDREPVTIPAESSAEEALDGYFHRYRWDWFATVEADGRFAGVVRRPAVEDAVLASGGSWPVRRLVEADAADWRVGQDAPLERLVSSEPLRRLGALMAVDGDGVLRGVVTVEQVQRALERSLAGGLGRR